MKLYKSNRTGEINTIDYWARGWTNVYTDTIPMPIDFINRLIKVYQLETLDEEAIS